MSSVLGGCFGCLGCLSGRSGSTHSADSQRKTKAVAGCSAKSAQETKIVLYSPTVDGWFKDPAPVEGRLQLPIFRLSKNSGPPSSATQILQSAPRGTLWIFFQTCRAVGSWYGHVGLALRKGDGTVRVWHLDGAKEEGKNPQKWLAGEAAYEFDKPVESLYEDMDWSIKGQQILFYPLFNADYWHLYSAARDFKREFPRYDYGGCNCSLFTVSMISSLFEPLFDDLPCDGKFVVPPAAMMVGGSLVRHGFGSQQFGPPAPRKIVGKKNIDSHSYWEEVTVHHVPRAFRVEQSVPVLSLQVDASWSDLMSLDEKVARTGGARRQGRAGA